MGGLVKLPQLLRLLLMKQPCAECKGLQFSDAFLNCLHSPSYATGTLNPVKYSTGKDQAYALVLAYPTPWGRLKDPKNWTECTATVNKQGIVCTQTVIRRQKVIQEAGDCIITLMGLRCSSLYAHWYHNELTLLKNSKEDFYVCTGCGHCGFAHPVRMQQKIGMTMYTAEIASHPPMVKKCVVEEV